MTIQTNLKAPFSIFRDEDYKLYIVDDNERVVLSDVFAYDNDNNASNRMETIVDALNAGWSNT